MELFLFRPDEYRRLYNCSTYRIDEIPLERRSHKLLGATFIGLGVFYEVFYGLTDWLRLTLLYIPCLLSISKHLQNSAYKFMFYIGLTDLVCMFVNGILTGYFAMEGAVYCSHPTLIYITGCMGVGLWALESTSAMLLAINRCVEMWSPAIAFVFFRGNRTWLWMLIPSTYAAYFFFFTKPVLFSGLFLSWFFNPHIGYYDDFGLVYHNLLHSFHNCAVLFGLSGVYTIFILIIMARSSASMASRSGSQKKTFFQVLLISAVNATASAVYVYMQFARISELVIILGSYMWLSAHGMPSIIYLSMNRTIRNDCRKMFLRCLVGGDGEHLATTTISDSSHAGCDKRDRSVEDSDMIL